MINYILLTPTYNMRRRQYHVHSKKWPKAKLKDNWKQVKTPKWRYQAEDNYNDGITDELYNNFSCEYTKRYICKENMKKFNKIKHKIFFHIPFDNNDLEFMKQWPSVLQAAQTNVKNIIERDKRNEKGHIQCC